MKKLSLAPEGPILRLQHMAGKFTIRVPSANAGLIYDKTRMHPDW